MEIRRPSGEIVVGIDEKAAFTSFTLDVYKVGEQALKVPGIESVYCHIRDELISHGAAFSDSEFFTAILNALREARVALPEPCAVEELLVEGEKRTCFWQKFDEDILYAFCGGRFGEKLPLRPSRNNLSMEYCGPEFAVLDTTLVFFDWDLYFLYLHDRKLRDVQDYSRARLHEICEAIGQEKIA